MDVLKQQDDKVEAPKAAVPALVEGVNHVVKDQIEKTLDNKAFFAGVAGAIKSKGLELIKPAPVEKPVEVETVSQEEKAMQEVMKYIGSYENYTKFIEGAERLDTLQQRLTNAKNSLQIEARKDAVRIQRKITEQEQINGKNPIASLFDAMMAFGGKKNYTLRKEYISSRLESMPQEGVPAWQRFDKLLNWVLWPFENQPALFDGRTFDEKSNGSLGTTVRAIFQDLQKRKDANNRQAEEVGNDITEEFGDNVAHG